MAIRYWLGVVHLDHVRIAVRQGIAQFDHGARAAVERLGDADGVVYYSPRLSWPDGETLRAFTAIGRVADAAPFQPPADGSSGFRPWRRRIDYDLDAQQVPLRRLSGMLELTAPPNWGYQLRRGIVELSRHDFELIRTHMRRHPEA